MWNTEASEQRAVSSEQPVRRLPRLLFYCLLLTASCLLATGCRQDMQDQPRYEPYEAGDQKYFRDGKASRQLIEGTVPRVAPGREYVDVQTDYLYTGRAAAGSAQGGASVRANVPAVEGGAAGATQAGAQGGPDVFPFAIDEAALERGRERFNVYCAMCHGLTGEGDGMIVRRGFRKPPSFHEDRLQEPAASASHFFDVVSNGWGAMPSYADMIPAEDRWKIIAYVRALQLSRKGKVDDVPAAERGKLQAGGQPAATQGGAAGAHGEGQPGQGDKVNH